ncbi:MAG: SDR family oxidoreductase [Pseudomonadota bacterium]
MQNLFSVRDRVVIVTGAARGNGRAIAEGFMNNGAEVYFVDVLKEVEGLVDSYENAKAHSLVCDLTDRVLVEDLVRRIVEKSKRIDVLINNAGISIQRDDPYEEESWDRTMEINLKAAFRLSRLVSGVMMIQKQGGAIINITSLGAELGFSNNPSYVASKGGLKQLGKAMALDLAKYGIRVNNVCPGYMMTAMTAGSYTDPELKEERSRRTMLRRWGLPEDLVGPCLFLASDASAYITGIDLVVDGGWLAKGL